MNNKYRNLHVVPLILLIFTYEKMLTILIVQTQILHNVTQKSFTSILIIFYVHDLFNPDCNLCVILTAHRSLFT